jgi:GTP pyrophosphokinase
LRCPDDADTVHIVANTSIRVEPGTESELATTALRFARRAHLGQHRKQTHEQFVEHPIAVARLLSEAGFDGPMLAAAYLHDVVEKTGVQLDEIQSRFGPEVASTVDSLSENPELSDYGERKRALRRQVLAAGRTPTIIYAADRVANMRDWGRVAPEDRREIGSRLDTTLEERLELWDEDLEELNAIDPGLPFLAELEIELRALHSDVA